MKKIYLTLLSAALVTGFISCNGKSDGEKNDKDDTTTVAQQDDAANMVSGGDTADKTSVPADADKMKSDDKSSSMSNSNKMSGDNKMSTSSKAPQK